MNVGKGPVKGSGNRCCWRDKLALGAGVDGSTVVGLLGF
jgi:hypothetical protein